MADRGVASAENKQYRKANLNSKLQISNSSCAIFQSAKHVPKVVGAGFPV